MAKNAPERSDRSVEFVRTCVDQSPKEVDARLGRSSSIGGARPMNEPSVVERRESEIERFDDRSPSFDRISVDRRQGERIDKGPIGDGVFDGAEIDQLPADARRYESIIGRQNESQRTMRAAQSLGQSLDRRSARA